MFIVYLFRSCRDKEINMNAILANIIATGDSSKPLLVAICLIVSIVLMVVLIMVGKGGNGGDDEPDEEEKDRSKH